MSKPNSTYQEWEHYKSNQEFEHQLIDRKTTWLLTTQAILFAAYGVALDENCDKATTFGDVVALSGLAIASILLIGILALINSKRLSFHQFRKYFKDRAEGLPEPLNDKELQWGVVTWNTRIVLLPDVALPLIFIAAWLFLFLK